jgi:hypothetical protein
VSIRVEHGEEAPSPEDVETTAALPPQLLVGAGDAVFVGDVVGSGESIGSGAVDAVGGPVVSGAHGGMRAPATRTSAPGGTWASAKGTSPPSCTHSGCG